MSIQLELPFNQAPPPPCVDPDLQALADLFWAKQTSRPEGECWIWQGGKAGGRKTQPPYGWWHGRYAHHWVYEFCHGPIPRPCEVDHRCRVSLCVNPTHVRAGSHKQNMENVGPYASNTTGYRGVTPAKGGRFGAQLVHWGKHIWIGTYDTPEQAAEAVREHRSKLFTFSDSDRPSDGDEGATGEG